MGTLISGTCISDPTRALTRPETGAHNTGVPRTPTAAEPLAPQTLGEHISGPRVAHTRTDRPQNAVSGGHAQKTLVCYVQQPSAPTGQEPLVHSCMQPWILALGHDTCVAPVCPTRRCLGTEAHGSPLLRRAGPAEPRGQTNASIWEGIVGAGGAALN